MRLTDAQIADYIRSAFERNFEQLKLESGHSLTEDVKETARWQVLLYWFKLKEIAARVTETEVRLNLPNQTSPRGRRFGIEGIVDIVRDDQKTTLYDIKTHEAAEVRENLPDYEHQLDIYAHIWQNLRGQSLDETAIIATAFPDSIKAALKDPDRKRLAYELQKWDPLVELDFSPDRVQEVIDNFGRVVDCIEDGQFEPASMEKLKSRQGLSRREFASHVCRHCDARFSCDSYRQYALGSYGRAESDFRQYLEDFGDDLEQQDWLSGNLDAASPAEELE
jgi:hypothetical protein